MSSLDKMDPDVWGIQAELSGSIKVDKEILPIEPQGTLVRKYQQCGKNCRTCREGKGHGPYLWRVIYDKETKRQLWKFIKKDDGNNGVKGTTI